MLHSSISFEPAFVLHRRAFSNNSLIVEFFTLTSGRFALIAKGAAASKKGRSGLLQPFNPLLIRWSGRGQIKTLTQAEANGPGYRLLGDTLYCGFYLNELLMKLVEREDPHQTLYMIYSETLDRLSSKAPVELTLRYFELDLLSELGFGLELETEAETGQPVNAAKVYSYQNETGVVAEAREGVKVQGSTLLDLSRRVALDEKALKEAKAITRYVLAYYLEGRPLKSRELFASGK